MRATVTIPATIRRFIPCIRKPETRWWPTCDRPLSTELGDTFPCTVLTRDFAKRTYLRHRASLRPPRNCGWRPRLLNMPMDAISFYRPASETSSRPSAARAGEARMARTFVGGDGGAEVGVDPTEGVHPCRAKTSTMLTHIPGNLLCIPREVFCENLTICDWVY